MHIKLNFFSSAFMSMLLGITLSACTTQTKLSPIKDKANLAQAMCMCAFQPREYIVFFKSNSSALSRRSQEIIGIVAGESKEDGFTPITVSGFTDTAGNSKDNMILSLKRAKAVSKLLINDGVPKRWIVVKAYGDTNLIVPTQANVAYAPNRRVEIVRKSPMPSQPSK
jgi:outer membrane protein OmpA-like peptidoglycan-associated protein